VLVWARVASVLLITLAASSCAALYNIDEPKIGVIAKDQLPAFQKAFRCELITFIQANQARKERFDKEKALHHRELAVRKYKYFELDKDLFGSALLDLKVIDTVGLPSMSGSNLSYRYQFSPLTGTITNSQTAILSPSLTDQNTYEWQWIYLIPQNATLYGPIIADGHRLPPVVAEGPAKAEGEDPPFQCYRAIPALAFSDPREKKLTGNFEGLADGDYPQYEQFERIRVNGHKPFAAWLLENGSVMGTSFFAGNKRAEKAEQIIPAQMYYNFAIQISGGLNVSFSLISPKWNPLAPVVTAQQQQTNNLQIWLNGPDAALAAGAKTGTAQVISRSTPLPALPPGKAPETPRAVPAAPPPCTARGCLLAPVPLIGPGPSPTVPPP
jgi:hypothetical protein